MGASDVMKSRTRIRNTESKGAVTEGPDGSPREHCGEAGEGHQGAD